MAKLKMDPARWMYPRPALLVGANVEGKANFMAVGGGGVTNADPPMIGIPIRHHQYTLQGIKQNFTFSINTPSADLIRETDYCGIVSGRTRDKVKDCNFTIFYGELETAPLIEQCPINLECSVADILDLGSHAFIIGEVKGTYINEDCLVEGKPDIRKINPMVFNLEAGEYTLIGNSIGKAFGIGRELKGV